MKLCQLRLLPLWLSAVSLLICCHRPGQVSLERQQVPAAQWSTQFTTQLLSGDGLKTLDFQITPEMAGGGSNFGVEVRMVTGAISLVGCDQLWSVPNYDEIYALLLRMDGAPGLNLNFKSLRSYLDTSSTHGTVSVLDVAYYLPAIKSVAGERWPLCRNGRIQVDRVSEHWLTPGRYRVVLASYRDFCTEVRLSCKPKDQATVVHIEASDEMDMRERYRSGVQ